MSSCCLFFYLFAGAEGWEFSPLPHRPPLSRLSGARLALQSHVPLFSGSEKENKMNNQFKNCLKGALYVYRVKSQVVGGVNSKFLELSILYETKYKQLVFVGSVKISGSSLVWMMYA